ncbi:histidine kinase [Paenibacillus sp. IB182496]|uniref:histidine kinase n=1 Tax=Paenibacillus sabuli TaxID=2772509 RepID=A0A927GQJ6_9BACL|nr:sensor histidine kinase [Paenibacillus sabuli]MBD2843960.1 histidine kinase [Paenibacillus sabuli]
MKNIVARMGSSMTWRLIILFSSIIVFIVVAVAAVSFFESSKSIKQDAERFSTQILKEANLNLGRYFRDYEQFFSIIAASETFRQWLQAERVSSQGLAFTNLKDNLLRPFAVMHPEFLSLTLLDEGGRETFYSAESGPALRYDYRLREEPWLPERGNASLLEMRVAKSRDYLGAKNRPLELTVLTIVKKYTFSASSQGYIKMDLALAPIEAILSELLIEASGHGMIVDREGRIMAHTQPEQATQFVPDELSGRLQDSHGSFYLPASDQLITYRSIDKTAWRIVSSLPYRELTRSVYKVKDMTVAITAIGLVVSAVLVIVVSASSTRRLKRLREAMIGTNLGNLEVRMPVEGRDEVADLGRVFNKMLDNLHLSLEELERTRSAEQTAVLRALQSQIHSHFLYNALESIKSMAYIADQGDIVRTTLALSDMLRYISSYRDAEVPLEREVQYIGDYLHIMQTQYGDELTYTAEIEPGLEQVGCLKAIIQPLVENSIRHGLEQTGEPLHIELRISRLSESCVQIRVADNGPGFATERLRELEERLRRSDSREQYRGLSSIGMLNVHYRLRIYYGDERAGMTLRNRAGGGAQVELTLPLTRFAEGREQDVSHTHRRQLADHSQRSDQDDRAALG